MSTSLGAAEVLQHDIESSRSAPVRLRTAPNLFDTDKSGVRCLPCCLHEMPWWNRYLSQ